MMLLVKKERTKLVMVVEVIKEELFADLHAAQEVARLIIAHAVPARTAQALQVMDGQFGGFRFHQPMGHGGSSLQ